ncbi:MAG: hypothetical protein OK455_00145 [Thaumarchaeota archaeon]|nr:hypothetical protein [Nitrososphaerota archaeon]
MPKPMPSSGAVAKVHSYLKEQSPANRKSINRLRKIVKAPSPSSKSGCDGFRSGMC